MLYKFVDQRFRELAEAITITDEQERLYWVRGTLRDPYFEMKTDVDDVADFLRDNPYEVDGKLGVVFTTLGVSPRDPSTVPLDKQMEFLTDINVMLGKEFDLEDFVAVYTTVFTMKDSMSFEILKEKYEFIVPSRMVFLFLNNLESTLCIKNSMNPEASYTSNVDDYPNSTAIKVVTSWVMDGVTRMKQRDNG